MIRTRISLIISHFYIFLTISSLQFLRCRSLSPFQRTSFGATKRIPSSSLTIFRTPFINNGIKASMSLNSDASNATTTGFHYDQSNSPSSNICNQTDQTAMKAEYRKLDREFLQVALPAFVSLAADPLASLVDAIYVARLGAVAQAAMGIAVSAQFSVAKLYNDPLLKTSTSIVAGKEGEDLEASVAAAVVTAAAIGLVQMFVFLLFGGTMLSVLGVGLSSEMRRPALEYLRWRALGVPAATMLLVVNGIFRGRGDTQTPLYCTILGSLVNVALDPLLIFSLKMGCSGAGAATAISQWVATIPLVFLLHRKVPLKIFGRDRAFFADAAKAYLRAGGLLFLRTVAKILAYAVTSGAAARLGTVTMAAYSLTFNLGFATSQLCESISIAVQALLAREFPFRTRKKQLIASHLIKRALTYGILVSAALSVTTLYNQDKMLAQLTKSPAVFEAARQIMPVVLVTQLIKGLTYSTGGIILGGLDWFWSSLSMQVAAMVCVATMSLLPASLWNIWVALAAFMATQVGVAGFRFLSKGGPWEGVSLFKDKSNVSRESAQ